MTTKQAYNKELAYHFKDYVTINLIFSSDSTLYWKEQKSGIEANEKIKTIHLNNHTTLTGWVETDKTIVSLFSDFATGKTYGFQYFSNGKIRKLIGAIKPTQPMTSNDTLKQLRLENRDTNKLNIDALKSSLPISNYC